jgi:hypothetical protein
MKVGVVLLNEIWKDIVGYEGLYQVSNLGRVKSLPKYDRLGRFHNECIKASVNNGNGYLVVNLKHNGSQQMKTVHRLVAETFLINPTNLTDINHKDGNKSNNVVTNLEWCTRSENMTHAVKNGLHTNFGNRKVMCIELNLIFDSIKQAEEWVGVKGSRISNVCQLKRGCKTCGGYHWRYVE